MSHFHEDRSSSNKRVKKRREVHFQNLCENNSSPKKMKANAGTSINESCMSYELVSLLTAGTLVASVTRQRMTMSVYAFGCQDKIDLHDVQDSGSKRGSGLLIHL